MKGNRAVKFLEAIPADAHGTGTVNGVGIDCRGHEILEFAISVSTPAGGATLDLKVQDAPVDADGVSAGAYADVEDGALAQQTTDAGLKVIRIEARRLRGFARLVGVVAVAAYDFGAIAVLRGGQTSQPEADADLNIGFA